MKHIKHFETIENVHTKPQIGDYVICEEDTRIIELTKFVNNNIGKVLKLDVDGFYIIYENIPSSILEWFNYDYRWDCRFMKNDEIKYFSPNKEDLETILRASKYNL